MTHYALEMPAPAPAASPTTPLQAEAFANIIGERRTATVSILAAAFLTALKLITGLLTGSLGLVSTGIESSGDVVAASVTLFAVRVSARPADADHPYGHRRAENLSALMEAAILLVGGGVVVVEGVQRLTGSGASLSARWYVFAVILVAIGADLSRFVVSLRTSVRYRSAALRSNAFHFAGDLGGSIAVLAGLIAVRSGFADGDAIVAAIILAAAARLIFENAQVLMDTAPASAQLLAHDAVVGLGPDIELHRLRLRESAGRYFADVVVSVPPGRAVVEGHAAADEVEQAVQAALPSSDVVVHVEPRRRGLELRDRVLAIALSEPLVREAHDITIFEHGERVSVSLHLKLPADSSLADAHAVAERVERAVGRLPRIGDVRTHLEPLERPIAADPNADVDIDRTTGVIETLTRELTGHPAGEVRVLPTAMGSVVFMTILVDAAAPLAEAHRLASELEEALRRRLPGIADVVVHTEPLA
jgi:cation diffusion facilitator family transporter